MPYEITLCAGGDCPIQQFCHRNTAEILGRQDFFGTIPFDFSNKTCHFFLKNELYFEYIRKKAYEIWKTSDKSAESSLTHWQLAEDDFLDSF